MLKLVITKNIIFIGSMNLFTFFDRKFLKIRSYEKNCDVFIAEFPCNEAREIKLKIEQKGGKYIGTIIYMIPEKYVDGQSPKDNKNPDEKLRERPLVGLQILSGLEYDAKKKEWKSGKIYDPQSGNTYDCFAWLEKSDLLKMKGFVAGIRLLGRSAEWYLAEE